VREGSKDYVAVWVKVPSTATRGRYRLESQEGKGVEER
jgi:hypothetical protein